jgi:hypothetical protein
MTNHIHFLATLGAKTIFVCENPISLHKLLNWAEYTSTVVPAVFIFTD